MKRVLPLLLLLSLFLTSCKGSHQDDNGKINVYTSFYAMYDFARTIGGDDINVINIVPTGTEPHDFEPTASDMAKLSSGNVFIYNGAGMDDWAQNVSSTLPESVKTVCASDGLEIEGSDPHVWLSMENAKKQLNKICDALSEADKSHAQNFRTRTDEYISQIDNLEQEYKSAEFNGQTLLVTHGAYGYLCREIGIHQLALTSGQNETEASPSQIADSVKASGNKNVKAIYYDPLDGDKLAKVIASEANIETMPLYTFEGDSENRDYITIMRENLEQLKKGL